MRKNTIAIALFLAILAGIVAIACGAASESGATATDTTSPFVVELAGIATGEARVINGIEHTCFDLNMTEPASGRVIGTATDCLDLKSVTPIGDDGGLRVFNTTFFKFKDGTLVSRSDTTVQPVSSPLPAAGPSHITGEVAATDNILPELGTGRFKGATGNTRLSGQVDMRQFKGPGTQIDFGCIFVINVKGS